MLKMAVIGKDVSKSDSAKMHTFDMQKLGSACEYELLSVDKEHFDGAVKKLIAEYDAFNVTIPYKLDVIPYLTRIEGDARTFGAVNVVKDRVGYNTDGVGFMLLLENNGFAPAGKKILVLGAGGAGRSVIKKLADAGADVYAYDLRTENLDEVYSEFGGFTPLHSLEPADYDMIINVTGVGMHKTEGVSPVGEEFLSRTKIACDLIYMPRKSEFLRIAESLGKPVINGEGMLFYQAYYGDCIVLGKQPQAAEAKRLFEEYKQVYRD